MALQRVDNIEEAIQRALKLEEYLKAPLSSQASQYSGEFGHFLAPLDASRENIHVPEEGESDTEDPLKRGDVPATRNVERCGVMSFPWMVPVLSGQPWIANRRGDCLCFTGQKDQEYPNEVLEIRMDVSQKLVQEALDTLLDNGIRRQPMRDSHNKVYKSLSNVIEGNEGRFCETLLGKRVDPSGSSVIVELKTRTFADDLFALAGVNPTSLQLIKEVRADKVEHRGGRKQVRTSISRKSCSSAQKLIDID
ncbi:hypothetical protein RJ639_008212 [Escallonia herrerae]|uniref:Uncharacterized protein n=1 Tax=Escallonia herrerae TaxID=1293975 RepID=A0AA88VSE3_9ASTE|nr:hypothetical protein RJ639_008212 [Escallonia herrerae]